MQHNRFEEPVTVLVGMGLPARIETVMEASPCFRTGLLRAGPALMPLPAATTSSFPT